MRYCGAPTGISALAHYDDTSEMIGQTILHYLVATQLGGGGMSVVLEPEDLKLHRHVALELV